MTRPKHVRPRWRYLAVTVRGWGEDTIAEQDLQAAVWDALRALHGDAGAARIGGHVVRCDPAAGRCDAIVRVHRGTEDDARAALATVDRIDGASVGVRVRGTSGTIRACEERYLGRDRENAATTSAVFDGVERPAVGWAETIDVRIDDAFVGATTFDCAGTDATDDAGS